MKTKLFHSVSNHVSSRNTTLLAEAEEPHSQWPQRDMQNGSQTGPLLLAHGARAAAGRTRSLTGATGTVSALPDRPVFERASRSRMEEGGSRALLPVAGGTMPPPPLTKTVPSHHLCHNRRQLFPLHIVPIPYFFCIILRRLPTEFPLRRSHLASACGHSVRS
jgi:hypothetical protein